MKFASAVSFLVAVGLAVTPAAAHEGHGSEPPSTGTDYNGPVGKFGNGFVHTYVKLAKDVDPASNRRAPKEMGIVVPARVMNSLPAEPASLIVDFPIQARNTPFLYMMFDWNPQGHEPAGIYDKPHFDFHFYMQELEEVMAIDPGPCSGLDCEDYEKARKPIPAEFNPAGYIDVGSVVPYMGNHLIDPTSPEFNGHPFTWTWLYGAYDGAITFYEPMITRDSLVNDPNKCVALKLPQAYAETGYYPTKSCTAYDSEKEEYRVTIQDFVYRVAPPAAGLRSRR